MNFRIIFILCLISSCGVKSNPLPPEGTAIPTIKDYFHPQEIKSNEEDEDKKEEK